MPGTGRGADRDLLVVGRVAGGDVGEARLDLEDRRHGGLVVVLAVRVDGLGRRERVAERRLRRPVIGPLTGTEERRDRDRQQDGDDEHDDHELDEGEALVLTVEALAKRGKHQRWFLFGK